MGRAGAIWGPQRGQPFLAKVTQSGTGAPVISTPVINELNAGIPTPARTSAGIYTLTLTGAFTVGKTFARVVPSNAAARVPEVVYTSVDVITLNFFDAATPSAADSGDFDLEIFIVN